MADETESEAIARIAREVKFVSYTAPDRSQNTFWHPYGWSPTVIEAKLAPDSVERNQPIINVESFIHYCEKWHSQDSEFYARQDQSTVSCIIDSASPGQPSYEDHQAKLELALDRKFGKWNDKSGKWLTQHEYADHLEDRHRDVVAPDGVDSAPTGLEIYDIAREFKLSRNMNFGSAIDLVNGQVDFSYKQENKADQTVKFPEYFYLGLPVYKGGPAYQIKIRQRYRVVEERLRLSCEIVDLGELMDDAFADTCNQVIAKFPHNNLYYV